MTTMSAGAALLRHGGEGLAQVVDPLAECRYDDQDASAGAHLPGAPTQVRF